MFFKSFRSFRVGFSTRLGSRGTKGISRNSSFTMTFFCPALVVSAEIDLMLSLTEDYFRTDMNVGLHCLAEPVKLSRPEPS